VWTGLGGRYQASYIPTVSGVGQMRVYDGLGNALPNSPYTVTVLDAASLVVVGPSPQSAVYFKWAASQAAAAMGLAPVQYNLFISTEPTFASLTAARYVTQPPAAALAVMLNPGVTYYFKVAVRVNDPFTGRTLDLDMSAAEYASAAQPF
jgi:hypothetical protein